MFLSLRRAADANSLLDDLGREAVAAIADFRHPLGYRTARDGQISSSASHDIRPKSLGRRVLHAMSSPRVPYWLRAIQTIENQYRVQELLHAIIARKNTAKIQKIS